MHEPGYRELCGLPVTRSDNAWVDRLWVIDDRGTNDGWISRIEEVRRRVRSAAAPNGPKRVMLTRGTLGAKRSLINSSQVHEALIRLGFDIVHPELETARGLAEKLCGVEIAIAVEGSAQDHCWLAMPPQSTFVAILPPTRFNAHGKMRADAIGINWAYVVADPHPEGFCLPTDRLLRTIDEVMRAAASRHS
jgi:capsular polysaccharide biosynthesis protein